MRFISIDLAWSARNLTGVAVVEGDDTRGRLVGTGLLRRYEDVVEFVLAHVGKEPAIIAIDAPLVVPNEAGRRPAEAEIGSVFARYRASAHSASRKRLAPNGTVRGEELVDRLEGNRFVHRAEVEALTPVRQAIEVHPHPAIISIFDLDQIIKHKARKKQPHDSRLTELRRCQACLPFLERKEPALLDARELLNLDPATLIKVKPD